MMKNNFYADWYKWDLHCHTPLDPQFVGGPNLNNGDEKKIDEFIEKYIQKLIDDEIKVACITDHFFGVDRDAIPYIKIYLPKLMEAARKRDVSILPGIEISLIIKDPTLHILLIFHPDILKNGINDIQSFLIELHGKQTATSKNVQACNKTIDEIYKKLEEYDWTTKCIMGFAHVDEQNGLLTRPGEARKAFWLNEHIKFVQWRDNPKRGSYRNYYENTVNDYKRKLAHFVSSDCCKIDPSIQSTRACLGDKYSYINTTPDFEGLWQICVNPNSKDLIRFYDEKIPENNTYISQITLDSTDLFKNSETNVHFKKDQIHFNSKMVAIIGPRGSGKSILVNTIGTLFNHIDTEKKVELTDKFLITLKTKDKEIKSTKSDLKDIDYIHVCQDMIKKILEKPKELNRHILKFLQIEELEFLADEEIINQKINKFFDNSKLIKEFDIEKNKNEENKILLNLEILSTNDTKLEIEKINKNQEEIAKIQKIEKLISKLIQLVDLFKSDFKITLNELISLLPFTITISEMDFTKTLQEIDELKIKLVQSIKQLTEEINQSKKILVEKGILDVDFKSDYIKTQQNELSRIREKIVEIEKYKLDNEQIINDLIQIIKNYFHQMQDYMDNVNNNWINLKKRSYPDLEQTKLHNKLMKDLEINAYIYFDVNRFYEYIAEFTDSRRMGNIEKAKNVLSVLEPESFKKFILNQKIINKSEKNLFDWIADESYFKSGKRYHFLQCLYQPNTFKDFLTVLIRIKYDHKPIEELSAGQKGSIYLNLKLATASFSLPFIFDQPENDIDHFYIQDHLVELFSKIKNYRQVIIVTHNSNLVVNCHPEQVIVANNDGGEISFESGYISNDSVKEKICHLLEGGEPAFKERGQKYRIFDEI